MKISDITVDQKLVEEGAWVGDIPELEGVRFKVRGLNNRDWRRQAQALINAVPRKKRTPYLDPDEADRINIALLANCGLLDWEGIVDDDDKPIPYDRKKAAEYLRHQKFRDGVFYACSQVAEGIADEIEETSGN